MWLAPCHATLLALQAIRCRPFRLPGPGPRPAPVAARVYHETHTIRDAARPAAHVLVAVAKLCTPLAVTRAGPPLPDIALARRAAPGACTAWCGDRQRGLAAAGTNAHAATSPVGVVAARICNAALPPAPACPAPQLPHPRRAACRRATRPRTPSRPRTPAARARSARRRAMLRHTCCHQRRSSRPQARRAPRVQRAPCSARRTVAVRCSRHGPRRPRRHDVCRGRSRQADAQAASMHTRYGCGTHAIIPGRCPRHTCRCTTPWQLPRPGRVARRP